MNNCVKFVGGLKSFLQYINIFDIPRLAREISCDVKHIREKYDETITSIEKYKEALQLEREKGGNVKYAVTLDEAQERLKGLSIPSLSFR